MRNILRMIQMRWWCDVSSDEKINLLVTSLTRALPWIFPSSSSPKFTCIFNRIKMYWKSVSVDPNLRLRTKANYSVILGVAVLCISHLHMPGNKKLFLWTKKVFLDDSRKFWPRKKSLPYNSATSCIHKHPKSNYHKLMAHQKIFHNP